MIWYDEQRIKTDEEGSVYVFAVCMFLGKISEVLRQLTKARFGSIQPKAR